MATRISEKLYQDIRTLAKTNVKRMGKQAQADYIISLSRAHKMTPHEFFQVMKPVIARNRAKSGDAYEKSLGELLIFQAALFNARQAYRTMLAIRNGKGKVDRKPEVKAKAKRVAKAKPVTAPAPAPVKVSAPEVTLAQAFQAISKALFAHS